MLVGLPNVKKVWLS